MLCGDWPTGTVVITLSLVVSIIETTLDSWFAAYSVLPSAETSTQCGFGATLIVLITLFVAVSITVIDPESWLGT